MAVKLLGKALQSNAPISALHETFGGAIKKLKGAPIVGAGKKSRALWSNADELSKNSKVAKESLSSLQDAYKFQVEDIAKQTGDSVDNVMKHMRDGDMAIAYAGKGLDVDDIMGMRQDAMNESKALSQTIFEQDKEAFASRMGAAASYMTGDGSAITGVARYGGAAVGLRYMSGGTLTRNNKGEKDIAGIPMI